MKYDYLVVGAGLFGAVFAREAAIKGKHVLIVERRPHIGGNIYTENIEGINVHKYGAHIFHTSDKEVWDYVNNFAEFNRYTNSPVAVYKDELYNLPFNMNTFSRMWGVKTPKEARAKIMEQIESAGIKEPSNLEEQAISLVGRDIYEKLIEGYTRKQWGRPCKELPAFIIKRLPVRFEFDNNYFNDKYQGIPIGGYTRLIENILNVDYPGRDDSGTGPSNGDKGKIEIRLNTDFLSDKESLMNEADKIIYTGMIDEFYDYCLGELEYRSLRFETQLLDMENYQGNAVVNYTEYEIPYTRIIEHKHFELMCRSDNPGSKTVITREYPTDWKRGDEPYYPLNDDKNSALYARYKEKADAEGRVIFGGRLGQYKYYDMHQVVAESLRLAKELL